MQIFKDMFEGDWFPVPATRPKWDAPPGSAKERFCTSMWWALRSNHIDAAWTRWVGDAWLQLGYRHGLNIYVLIDAHAGEWLGNYHREMDALEAVQKWIDYLEGGGTVQDWLAHHRQQGAM
jgi:hypothetical protein